MAPGSQKDRSPQGASAAPGLGRASPKQREMLLPVQAPDTVLVAVVHAGHGGQVADLVFGKSGYWASKQNYRQSGLEKNIVKNLQFFIINETPASAILDVSPLRTAGMSAVLSGIKHFSFP